jgi:hypothetical protein
VNSAVPLVVEDDTPLVAGVVRTVVLVGGVNSTILRSPTHLDSIQRLKCSGLAMLEMGSPLDSCSTRF